MAEVERARPQIVVGEKDETGSLFAVGHSISKFDSLEIEVLHAISQDLHVEILAHVGPVPERRIQEAARAPQGHSPPLRVGSGRDPKPALRCSDTGARRLGSPGVSNGRAALGHLQGVFTPPPEGTACRFTTKQYYIKSNQLWVEQLFCDSYFRQLPCTRLGTCR